MEITESRLASLFTELSAQGLQQYEEILKNKDGILQSCTSFKYGIGGLNLPARGYFCPSLIMDTVVGNCSRGRLVCKPKSTTHPDFKYGFTKEGELVYIESLYEGKKVLTEYILRENNVITGFTFNDEDVLVNYSREQYQNGRLIAYSLVFYDEILGKAYSLHNETYNINDRRMTASFFDYEPKTGKLSSSCRGDYYCFYIDNEGYLMSYYPSKNGIDPIDDRVFECAPKRRRIIE